VLNCADTVKQDADVLRAAVHEHTRTSSWTISSVTAGTAHVARITRSSDADADDPTQVVGTDTASHRADAGMAWGSLIHGLLEHAMRHYAATRDDLRRLAMWLTVEQPQLRASIDQAIDTVLRVARAEFWQMAKAGEHSEETPVMVMHDPRTLTNGVVDLLFKSEEGWRIRDYKTDLSLNEQAYEGQLQAYRAALEKLQCQVIDAALVHVRVEEH
jgi:ATP-dependent exoDNAse (exonuclease V) beta subunit